MSEKYQVKKMYKVSPKCWSKNLGSKDIREKQTKQRQLLCPTGCTTVTGHGHRREATRGISQHHNHSKWKQTL